MKRNTYYQDQQAKFDAFYKTGHIFDAALRGQNGADLALVIEIAKLLEKSKAGDKDAESALCNKVGAARRSLETPEVATPLVKQMLKDSIDHLRGTGRKVNLKLENPALWITMRDGSSPRW